MLNFYSFQRESMAAEFIELTENGYRVKTSQATPGTQIHCPEDKMVFEKTPDGNVKVIINKKARITKA